MITFIPVDPRLVERILAEYREMPRLRLSSRQAARLWALEPELCAAMLDALVEQGDLARSPRGEYCARADAEWARRSPTRSGPSKRSAA